MPEPVTVTSEPVYVDFHGTVTSLCDDLRKMHERLMSNCPMYKADCIAEAVIQKMQFAEIGGHIESESDDLGCGGEGSQ